MCGISGYIGSHGEPSGQEAMPIILGALKKLEYRGYDSAGIALVQTAPGLEQGGAGLEAQLVVRKAKGRIAALEERLAKEAAETGLPFGQRSLSAHLFNAHIGIGHTRWATHGEPSDQNSHPHTDVSGRIAVVHNGIIENYLALKEWLQARDVVFASDTDTEVIAHLINYYYTRPGEKRGLFEAALAALERLEGSYAIAVVSADYPDRIIAARKDSPLIIGLGKGENFLSSDAPAFLQYTRDAIFLNDGELAVLYSDHVDLFTSAGERVIREPAHIDWDAEAAEKGGYAHFMLKEICEQPRALKDTCAKFAGANKDNIDDWLSGGDAAPLERLVIIACGTAYHAAIVGKYAFEQIARIPVEVDIASEFRYRNPVTRPGDRCIVISQSGETADTLAAFRLAKSLGLPVLAITNVLGSTLAREAGAQVLYTLAGPEIAVASTKAFTTQLMCLYMLALKIGRAQNALDQGQFSAYLEALNTIPGLAQSIIEQQEAIQKFAARQFNKTKVFFMGRLYDYAVSLESALKLKEISYTHSEAFAAGELKHGPIALVDKSTLVVAIATQEALFDKIASNIKEVAARGASTLVITWEDGGKGFSTIADAVFAIPKTLDCLSPMLAIIPAQLFAYYCAIQRGNDPDKPRNLAKSVTVE
jgi:glucosamine--fructose-6-phosphate aminotransferase (isomerizing)